MLSPIKFANYLQFQADEIKKSRSAKKARLRLLAALARLLEQSEFNDIKVLDITDEAGLSKAAFFIYFKAKEDIVDELLRQYVDFERVTVPEPAPDIDTYQSLREAIAWYEHNFAVNHGILVCLIHLGGTSSDYRELWRERNAKLLERWAQQFTESLGFSNTQQGMLAEVIHQLGAILDHSMFERYGLGASPASQELDSETLIDMHAVLIYRALYCRNPPTDPPKYMKPLIDATP